MSKKVIIIFISVCITLYAIFSEEKSNAFLEKNDSPILNEIFTVNVGIMNFKEVGNIKEINPIDTQNVVDALKNVLDKIHAVRLSKSEAVIKAVEVFVSKKTNKTPTTNGDGNTFLKKKLFLSQNQMDNAQVNELYITFKKNDTFSPIAKTWVENYSNPYYLLNVQPTFERIVAAPEEICNTAVTGKTLDLLIHGEVEKIDKYYIVTVYIYSNLLKKRVREFSFVSDSENISNKTIKTFNSLLPSLFLINYASLTIETEVTDVRLFLDSKYIGRDKVTVDYLVPGNYVIGLSKKDYEDKVINVSLSSFERKQLRLNMDTPKKLQVVDFFIEPLGTKIYINSIFQGKSPFKKALPKGNYIISAKNELYESHRYALNISDPEEKESQIVFHLKSKDINTYFKRKKMIYYATFWNFTFSLITTVPVLIFTLDFWNRAGDSSIAYNDFYDNEATVDQKKGFVDYENTEEGKRLYLYRDVFYGLSAVLLSYTAISLGFLVYGLINYLLSLEKRDFLPIIEYYNTPEGDGEVKIGASLKL